MKRILMITVLAFTLAACAQGGADPTRGPACWMCCGSADGCLV
jgi:hypothetical protein